MVALVAMTTAGSPGVFFFFFLQRVDDTPGDFHEGGGQNKVDGLCGFVMSDEDVAG